MNRDTLYWFCAVVLSGLVGGITITFVDRLWKLSLQGTFLSGLLVFCFILACAFLLKAKIKN